MHHIYINLNTSTTIHFFENTYEKKIDNLTRSSRAKSLQDLRIVLRLDAAHCFAQRQKPAVCEAHILNRRWLRGSSLGFDDGRD